MIPASDHIDLDREFAPPAANDDLDSNWHRALANITGNIKKWHQLSALATVILGEGGTGKTHEFRVRQASLNSQGKAAFFVPSQTSSERTSRGSSEVTGERSRSG